MKKNKEKYVVLKGVIVVLVIALASFFGVFTFNYVYVQKKVDAKYEKYLISKERENALKKYKTLGVLKIDKINLEYNILNEAKEDALEISVAKLYGSNPSEVGNMCVIGKNLKSKLFFGRIHLLQSGDKIEVTDNNGSKVEYAVYNVYTTSVTDSEFLTQITGGKREITLVTDSQEKDKRTIVKAREI